MLVQVNSSGGRLRVKLLHLLDNQVQLVPKYSRPELIKTAVLRPYSFFLLKSLQRVGTSYGELLLGHMQRILAFSWIADMISRVGSLMTVWLLLDTRHAYPKEQQLSFII